MWLQDAQDGQDMVWQASGSEIPVPEVREDLRTKQSGSRADGETRMRQAFINTLIQLAEQDKDVWLLTADMGFGLVEQFATKFPKRYINVGVAEQNMIGVATGLALEDKKVFCYSIGNFPTMRCLEQIRNDVCYHNLPVCIVSGGAGLWYGNLGMTHWAVEDMAVMRALPNMAVVSPYSATKMVDTVKGIYEKEKPCYLRMSRPSSNSLLGEKATINGKSGSRVIILATGGKMVGVALEASRQLAQHKIAADVLAITNIKPFSSSALVDIIPMTDAFVTIEEHSRIGGLGSAVAEVLAELRHHPPLVIMGTRDEYPTTAMSYEELLKYHHLTHLTVEAIVKEALSEPKSS